MTLVIGIDPGYAARGKGNACAAYRDGVLVDTWFERYAGGAVCGVFDDGGVDLVIGERPAYQGKRTEEASPETLMRLSWEGALLAGAYAAVYEARLVSVTPDEWKGNEAKAANHERLWSVLSVKERLVLGGDDTGRRIDASCKACALKRWPAGMTGYPAGWLRHNELDAAAMVATVIGRIRKVA